METEHLLSFRTVATSGSFTAAAKVLSKSQSTVSGQIAKLEELLETRLFVRTTRSCQLTPEGRELLNHSTKVLNAVDQIHDLFRPTLLGGRVRVGVPDDPYLFPLITEGLREFMDKRPDVKIEIVAGLAENLNISLTKGYFDLAVLRNVCGNNHDDQICISQLKWIAAPDFVIPENGVLPLAHVSRPCAYFREASKALNENSIVWKNAVACTSLQGVLAMVRSKLAIAAILEDEQVEADLFAHQLDLPDLPHFGITFRFANDEPPMLARLIANAIRRTLTQG